MMKIAAIIAEYNPFHNGHAYHIQKTKEVLGVSGVVAVMSGNFTQRGDVAICDKFTRAAAAVCAGADLVVELPLPYCLSSANRFAYGGVYIISALGIADYISFGSECEDIETLSKLSTHITTESFSEQIKLHLESGVSYPQARSLAAKQLLGERYANILSSPNNILAIEYLTWQKKLCPDVIPFSLKREVDYHDLSYDKSISSAAAIRAYLKEFPDADVSGLVPKQCAELYGNMKAYGAFPVFSDDFDNLAFSHLLRLSKDDIKKLPDVSEGLENRIYDAIRESRTLNELYDNIKTKRYTHSRIRRIIMCAFLGLTKQSVDIDPGYIRILAFNKTGSRMLRLAKEKATLPIITKAAHVNRLSSEIKAQFEKEAFGSRLYALCADDKNFRDLIDDYKRMPAYIR